MITITLLITITTISSNYCYGYICLYNVSSLVSLTPTLDYSLSHSSLLFTESSFSLSLMLVWAPLSPIYPLIFMFPRVSPPYLKLNSPFSFISPALYQSYHHSSGFSKLGASELVIFMSHI